MQAWLLASKRPRSISLGLPWTHHPLLPREAASTVFFKTPPPSPGLSLGGGGQRSLYHKISSPKSFLVTTWVCLSLPVTMLPIVRKAGVCTDVCADLKKEVQKEGETTNKNANYFLVNFSPRHLLLGTNFEGYVAFFLISVQIKKNCKKN